MGNKLIYSYIHIYNIIHTYTFTETIEVEDESIIKGSGSHRKRKPSESSVEIVELPVDETENKSISKTKRESVEEIEIIETDESLQKTKKKKILKTKRSETEEYPYDEETEDIKPFELASSKQFPINTPAIVSEATASSEAAQIDQKIMSSKVEMNIIPLVALSQQTIQYQEKENIFENVQSLSASASKSISTQEAYEVTEQNVHGSHGQFDKEFKPNTFSAKQDITQCESYSTEEVHSADVPSSLLIDSVTKHTADFAVLPQEAQKVIETNVGLKEDVLQPLEMSSKKPLSLHTPCIYSEAVSTGAVAQLNENVIKSTAELEIQPHSAIIEEEIVTQEKEGDHQKTTSQTVSATQKLDTFEAYQVSEQLEQNAPDKFDTIFKPKSFQAERNISPNEGLTVEEITAHESSSNITENIENSESKAIILLSPQEAKYVSEIEVSDKEKLFITPEQPKGSQAKSSFLTKESINVEEVIENVFEEKLTLSKPTESQSKVKIDSSESILVEEVIPQEKPGKFLPESFVATEIAIKNIIPQKSVTQTEIITPESESDYVPGKLPPQQSASLNISGEEAISVIETTAEDKESTFKKGPSPEKSTASSDIILSEGVTITLVDSQQPQRELSSEEIEKQSAQLNIIPKETVVSESVIPAESESIYNVENIVDLKTADTTMICLQTSSKSEVEIQESENILSPDEKPTHLLATPNIDVIEHLTISEVETGDTPSQFKDFPKFKTDTASSNIDTHEATNVTEVNTAESERHYIEEQVETTTADKSLTDTKKQIEITESSILERESELTVFELPDSHKSKLVTTHLLPIGITEEVTPEYQTQNLKPALMEEQTADSSQPALTETIISETITSESVKSLEEQHSNKTLAAVTVLPQESLSISQVCTTDKEKQYLPQQTPEMQQAIIDVDSQIVASSTEIHPQHSTLNLEKTEPISAQAIESRENLETIQVTQYQTAEKEKEHLIEQQIPEKQAVIGFSENLSVSNISQVIPNEKENLYEQQVGPLPATAVQSLISQEVIVKSENETVTHADSIEEQEIVTGRAKKYTKPFTELIITETNITDVEKRLELEPTPNRHQVHVDLIPGQELSITEIVTDDKESPLTYIEPITSQGNVNIEENKVAISEIVISNDQTATLKQDLPVRNIASTHQDTLEPLTQTEFIPAEKESEKLIDIIPDTKSANISFKEAESVHVTQVTPSDKETILRETLIPESTQGQKLIDTHLTAIKLEISTQDTLSELNTEINQTEKAKPGYLPLDSLIMTESVPIESESKYIVTEPEKKIAVSDYQLGEGLTVTSITAADKENQLQKEVPHSAMASSTVLQQEGISVTESVANDNLNEFEVTIPHTTSAQQIQQQLEGIINTEAIPGETESQLTLYSKPTLQSADIEFDTTSASIVSEVQYSEKEGKSQPFTLDAKVAVTSLDIDKSVAETNVVECEDLPLNLDILKPKHVEANVSQLTFESITLSNPQAQEKEGILQITETPETKTAQQVIDVLHKVPELNVQQLPETYSTLKTSKPETQQAFESEEVLNSLTITENILSEKEFMFDKEFKPFTSKINVSLEKGKTIVTVNETTTQEKESIFVSTEKPNTQSADITINTVNVPEQFEVTAQCTVEGSVAEKLTHSTSANIVQSPLEELIQTQTEIHEKEGIYEKAEHLNETTANVNIEGTKIHSVTEIVPAECENILISEKHPSTSKAVTNILEYYPTEHSEVESNMAIGELSESKPKGISAQESQDVLESLIQTVPQVEESFKEIESQSQPLSKQADTKLNILSELVITEILSESSINEIDTPQDKLLETAIVQIDHTKSIQQSEVETAENISDLKCESKTEAVANITQDTLESLIQAENILPETEKPFKDIFVPVTSKANPEFEKLNTVNITEIVSQEKENLFKEPSSNKQTVTPKLTEVLNIIAQTEVLSQETTGTFEKSKAQRENIDVIQDNYQSVIVSINEMQEKEKPFIQEEVDLKQADMALIPQEHTVNITETNIIENESEIHTDDKQEHKKAYSVIPEFEATQILEVKTEGAIIPLIQTQPTEEQAVLEHLPHNILNITEVTASEIELPITKKELPAKKTANVNIEESGKVPSVTEITTNQSESTFTEIQQELNKATKTLTQCLVPENTSVELLDTTTEIKEKPLVPKEKATTKSTPLQSLLATEIDEQGSTKQLNIEKTEYKSATIDVSTKEGIIITEIDTHGQVGSTVTDYVAKETLAKTEVEQHPVATNEEIITLHKTGEFKEANKKLCKAQTDIPETMHGLIVLEQKSTSNIDILKTADTPTSKNVKVVMEDITPSIQISEIQLHEHTGKFKALQCIQN